VNSAAELVNQIRTDPIVSRRFERFMVLPPHLIRLAFRGLHVERTKADMVRKVYYVHKGEKIGYVVRKVRKGTAVFASVNGSPILLKACANVMRPVSPSGAALARNIPYYSPTEEVASLARADFDTGYVLRDIMPGAADFELPKLVTGETSPIPPSYHVAPIEGIPGPPAFHVASPPHGPGLLGGLGGAAIVGAILSSGHSSNGPPPIIIVPHGPPETGPGSGPPPVGPPIVPETDSLWLLAGGMAGIGGWLLIARRRASIES